MSAAPASAIDPRLSDRACWARYCQAGLGPGPKRSCTSGCHAAALHSCSNSPAPTAARRPAGRGSEGKGRRLALGEDEPAASASVSGLCAATVRYLPAAAAAAAAAVGAAAAASAAASALAACGQGDPPATGRGAGVPSYQHGCCSCCFWMEKEGQLRQRTAASGTGVFCGKRGGKWVACCTTLRQRARAPVTAWQLL
jgi:hypothetical protein